MIKYQYLEDLASCKINKYKDTDIVQKAGPVTNYYYKGNVICIVNHYTSEFIIRSKAEAQGNIEVSNRIEAYFEYFIKRGYRVVFCFSKIQY